MTPESTHTITVYGAGATTLNVSRAEAEWYRSLDALTANAFHFGVNSYVDLKQVAPTGMPKESEKAYWKGRDMMQERLESGEITLPTVTAAKGAKA